MELIWENMELFWDAGEGLSLAALLYGAYLALMETKPFLNLFGKKSAAPLPLIPKDLRLIDSFAKHGSNNHLLSGNGAIDTQHQGLFNDINHLRTAILSGQSVDEVGATIDTLIRDVGQHFQDEEAMLEAANYPGTARHAARHRELVKSASTLIGQFRASTLGIGELFKFLAHDILTTHTLGADREFFLIWKAGAEECWSHSAMGRTND